jgi:hypothetical protein
MLPGKHTDWTKKNLVHFPEKLGIEPGILGSELLF